MEEALHLARAACEDGITYIIATPQYANGVYMKRAATIVQAVLELNDRLVKEGISLTVHPGQEIRAHDDLLDAWSRGDLLTLAGSSYLLIEMPSHTVPKTMPDLLHELSILGMKPVIAHPERNQDILRSPELMSELIDLGAFSQITTHSLLGSYNANVQKCAWSLCRRGWVHFVSSDAHHVIRRCFRLREAYDSIRSETRDDTANFYQNNAQLLIVDLEIDVTKSAEAKGWRKLFKDVLK